MVQSERREAALEARARQQERRARELEADCEAVLRCSVYLYCTTVQVRATQQQLAGRLERAGARLPGQGLSLHQELVRSLSSPTQAQFSSVALDSVMDSGTETGGEEEEEEGNRAELSILRAEVNIKRKILNFPVEPPAVCLTKFLEKFRTSILSIPTTPTSVCTMPAHPIYWL